MTYHNFVLHGSISVGSGRASTSGRSGTSGGVLVILEVIRHVEIQLFSGLLRRASILAAAFLVTSCASLGDTALAGIGTGLADSSGLGLGLGLTVSRPVRIDNGNVILRANVRSSFSQGLHRGHDLVGLRGADDDLDLVQLSDIKLRNWYTSTQYKP